MSDFSLAPKFALIRSYIAGLGFYAPPGSVIVPYSDGFGIDWPHSYSPLDISVRAVIKPEFLEWNSNRYTPDWIYSEYYAYFRGSPSTHFTYLPFTTFVHRVGNSGKWYLTNHLDIFADFFVADLPPAPLDFWYQIT